MRDTLIVKPDFSKDNYQFITPESANWEDLNFAARKMSKGDIWESETGEHEMGIILLGGNFSVTSDRGEWKTVNGRKDVFSGMPHTLYLPAHTKFSLKAESEILDIGYGWCKTDKQFEPVFKTPEDVAVEIRGGDNATRQINSLIEPGFPCDRLVAVEVYTPSGNWSSFPAHKHDERKVDAEGNVVEACLEETYFYKVDKPQGYAIQQVYTSDRSLDVTNVVHDNEVVLVPKGYHPVVAGHGYNVYYLNFLAGSDQSLANTPDPDHNWIFGTWKGLDERIPMVNIKMNEI
jgi:5-deoxy-glucuronate isomerase